MLDWFSYSPLPLQVFGPNKQNLALRNAGTARILQYKVQLSHASSSFFLAKFAEFEPYGRSGFFVESFIMVCVITINQIILIPLLEKCPRMNIGHHFWPFNLKLYEYDKIPTVSKYTHLTIFEAKIYMKRLDETLVEFGLAMMIIACYADNPSWTSLLWGLSYHKI